MSDPQFDHEKSASAIMQGAQGHMPAMKLLQQDGNFFTYAEFDRFTKKYSPEPRYVDPRKLRGDSLRSLLETTILKMNELIVVVNTVQNSILENMEQFAPEAKTRGK